MIGIEIESFFKRRTIIVKKVKIKYFHLQLQKEYKKEVVFEEIVEIPENEFKSHEGKCFLTVDVVSKYVDKKVEELAKKGIIVNTFNYEAV